MTRLEVVDGKRKNLVAQINKNIFLLRTFPFNNDVATYKLEELLLLKEPTVKIAAKNNWPVLYMAVGVE